MTQGYKPGAFREATKVQEELKKWLVRRVECIRGSLSIGTTIVTLTIFPKYIYIS